MTRPSRLRVLALAPYPDAAPSTRVRVSQYVPRLDAAGVDVHLHPFFDEGAYAAARREGVSPLAMARAWRRLRVVLGGLGGYDVVWVQRGVAPGLDVVAARLLTQGGTPFVYDFDDAVYLPQEGGRAWVEALRRPGPSTRAFCQGASVVLAGNDHLAVHARGVVGAGRASAVRVLPSVVDTDILTPATARPDGVPTLGWVGTDSTVPYLETLAPALASLAGKVEYRLAVVAGSRTPRIPGVDTEVVRWSLEREVEVLQRLDVGLYPLDDTPWSRGKCGFKALQYLSCGVPCVASPVGVLRDIVIPGRTGLLASSAEEWVDACSRLLGDAAWRRSLGAAGRERVKESYSLDSAVPMLIQAFDDAVSAPHA